MQRKWFVLLTGLVVFSLLIVPVGMVGAQGTPPPTPKAFQPFQPPSNPPFEMDGVGGNRSSLFPTASGVTTPATFVGESGFSFSYSKTIGITSDPYIIDTAHLNGPNGMFIDASDTLFVTEEKGHRALAYNSSGVNTMVLGHAGQPWAHDDFLSTPVDITKDGAGNIWVAYNNAALKEFDSSGNLVQYYPADEPWMQGDSNDRFNTPRGIAFNVDGLMFVSDTNNHRIQIYDNSGTTPFYLATIGVTGVPQSNNTGFNQPAQIAFDSQGRLYVVDTGNWRVQRCVSSSPWTAWSCEIFLGGEPGNDLTHIAWAYGIGIDSSDHIFIADAENARVLKCDTSAVCQNFAGINGVTGADNAHFSWPADVEVDSVNNVYVSDYNNFRIQKFNSAGLYQSTIGVSGIPYLTDTSHLNVPWGIARAADGSLYVTEQRGHRLIKMDADGVQEWSVGEAGVYGDDNAHFGAFWGGLEGSPAVDANGHVYVGDTPNNRVQIFNPDGSYYDTLGIGYGQGNYEFYCPTEVAVNPANNDIYVMDHCNQRVQVYTSAMVYKGTIGTTAVTGDDNLHFSSPWGLTVDANGSVFVADHDNHRIQKCILISTAPGFSCSTFLGETGVSGTDFNHFGAPMSVEVDGIGRVYVVDEWNSRVQVFDASGAYLTTIGGVWGTANGDFISPSGLVSDATGTIYIADRENHRIQVFTPGPPGWRQSNINGFGDLANSGIFSMATFDNHLFAGTANDSTGGQIWRSTDGASWTSVVADGFGDATNVTIDTLLAFDNQLYAGTYNWDNGTGVTTGGQLWRSSDGDTWTQLTLTGFDPLSNTEFFQLASYDSQLYVSTWTDGSHGGEIWRSSTGNSNDWSQVESNGFGDGNNQVVLAFASHDNYFYAGTANTASGAEVWRSPSGDTSSWAQVNTDGFGDVDRTGISALASFDGHLYAAVLRRGGTGGGEVWRCQVCDGTDWVKIVDDGFGNGDYRIMPSLEVSNGRLYLVLGNWPTGLGVWRTTDGLVWEQVEDAGFGTRNTYTTYFDNSVTTFGNKLYIGALNSANGGQIWRETMFTFTDVNQSYWAWPWIERLYAAGITGGCGTGIYCPGSNITRAQMAVFLMVAEHGTGYTPPAATGVFNDVPADNGFAKWIEQMAAEGITGGCGGGNYCPNAPVTREQMAVFLLVAKNGPDYTPPAAIGVFADVPADDPFAPWIEALAAEGITGGCGGGKFCPSTPVNRAQMAVFLVTAFDLP
jgi:hypothetical protein